MRYKGSRLQLPRFVSGLTVSYGAESHRVPMMVAGKLFRRVVPPLAAGDYFYRQIMNIQGAIAFGKIDLPSKSQQPYQFLPAILFRLRRISARQCLVLGGSGVSIFGRLRQKIRCKGSKLC